MKQKYIAADFFSGVGAMALAAVAGFRGNLDIRHMTELDPYKRSILRKHAPAADTTRREKPEYSVLASSWNKRGTGRMSMHDHIDSDSAARLQGYPDLARKIRDGQPGWKRSNGHYSGISKKGREVLAIHMLGNGVPAAMGNYIAGYVAMTLAKQKLLTKSPMR